MPRAERHQPLHVQISSYYRKLITEGLMTPGEQLPTIRSLAAEWGTGQNTAQRAVEHLRAASLVVTRQEGTFVAESRAVLSPQQRMRLDDNSGEQVAVTQAGPAEAPGYVTATLGITAGSAVRREQVYSRADGTACTVQVTWTPLWTATAVPELLAPEPLPDPAGPAHLISVRYGRPVTKGRCSWECRAASDRERELLNLGSGAYVLAGAYWWADAGEVLEYGEVVLPPNQATGADMEP